MSRYRHTHTHTRGRRKLTPDELAYRQTLHTARLAWEARWFGWLDHLPWWALWLGLFYGLPLLALIVILVF